jgi:hypothetical protein
MSQGLACPNPACTYAFPPEAVTGAANLKCPRCGCVFRFRAAAPAPAGPAPRKPAGPPTPAPPTRKPAPPAKAGPSPTPRLPTAEPVPSAALPVNVEPVAPVASAPVAVPVAPAGPHADLVFEDTAVIAPPRRRRRPGTRWVWTLLAVLLAVGVAAGGAASALLWLYKQQQGGGGGEGATLNAEPGNFQFTPPGPDWKPDSDIRIKLRANLALKRSNPSNAVAIFYRDYKTRLPSDAELVDEALTHLRSYLQGVEWELKPKDPATQLGGQPALELEFEGEDPWQVRVNGLCRLLAYRGYGYWFFTWGPAEEKDLVAPEWEGLRQRFALLNNREGWAERPRETRRVQGSKLPYELRYATGVWKKEKTDGYDPAADLVLIGREPERAGGKPLAAKTALLQVLLLDKAPDLKAAAAAAQAHLLKRQQQEAGGDNGAKVSAEPTTDKGGGSRDADVGDVRGHLSRLHVKNDDGLDRYALLGVVNRPEGVVVLMFECDWSRRDFWEQEFRPLLETFKLGERGE